MVVNHFPKKLVFSIMLRSLLDMSNHGKTLMVNLDAIDRKIKFLIFYALLALYGYAILSNKFVKSIAGKSFKHSQFNNLCIYLVGIHGE